MGNERRRKDLGEGTAAAVVTIKSLLFTVRFDCRMIYGRLVAVMATMLCFNHRSRRLFKHCYGIMNDNCRIRLGSRKTYFLKERIPSSSKNIIIFWLDTFSP